jgi:tetratricopeptide (TPR) repeat protein
MEFSDLDWKADKPKKDTNAEIWDFDLLNKSEGDVFDVKFLQSQADDSANRDRSNDKIIQGSMNKKGREINQVPKTAIVTNDQSIKDEKLAQLVSAGFETKKAQQALEACGWDMEMAVDFLFNNQSGSEMRLKSPTRQGSEVHSSIIDQQVFQALGISVFKGAQKVFDYSKKKITQVVESSKSSGWMNEKRTFNNSSSFQKENLSSRSGYPQQPLQPEQFLDRSSKTPPINSTINQNSSKIVSGNTSPPSTSNQFVSSAIGQTKPESLLIGDLTDSTVEIKEKEKIAQENQNLLDSSIEFVLDNSKHILNPTPSQLSAQPINNHLSKTLNQGINQPLNFSSTSQSSQNQHFASLKTSNVAAHHSLSNTTLQKPSNQSNLDSVDPFSGISDLGRLNTTAKATPMNATKPPANGLKLNEGKSDPKNTNYSRNETLKNTAFPLTNNQQSKTEDLLDVSFDFSSAFGKGATASLDKSSFPANTGKLSPNNGGKKPASQSFMMFDSISAGHTGASMQSNSVSENVPSKSNGHMYKEKGNNFFKSGQYAEAEMQYSLGLKSVPGDHPILAALYNNRAGARLKIGSYNEAIQDCNKVQEIEPNEVKSLLRRAQAYEALEKWDEAQSDYRKILVIDPTVKSVSQSLARCGRALHAEAPVSKLPKAPESMNLQNLLQPTQKRFYFSVI